MGADHHELLWADTQRPARGRPPVLSRERIVAEAVAIADAEGLQEVSMKRVAEQLGSGAMSLYRHVPGKTELVLLMFDSLMTEAPELPTGDGWRPAMVAWGHALRDMFHAHPWALSMVMDDREMGPNEAAWLDTALGAFDELDLPVDLALALVLAVDCYVIGAVRPEIPGGERGARMFAFLADPAARSRFPNLSRLATEVDITASEVLADYFDFGLQRLLDGFAQRIERG